jgi:Tol biopolymer transport system component
LETPPLPTWGTIWSPLDTAVAFVFGTIAIGSSDRTIRRFSTDSISARAFEALDWSPDGRHIAFLHEPSGGALFSEIWVLDVSTGARRRMFDEASAVDRVRFAPNGSRVVYNMNGSLYVRPFPGPGVAVRVLQGEGSNAAWSSDGRSLYFNDSRGNIASVPVSESGEATAAPTIVVPNERIEGLRPEYQELLFDVARGTNDLFVVASGSRRHTLTLVQNWRALKASCGRPHSVELRINTR